MVDEPTSSDIGGLRYRPFILPHFRRQRARLASAHWPYCADRPDLLCRRPNRNADSKQLRPIGAEHILQLPRYFAATAQPHQSTPATDPGAHEKVSARTPHLSTPTTGFCPYLRHSCLVQTTTPCRGPPVKRSARLCPRSLLPLQEVQPGSSPQQPRPDR